MRNIQGKPREPRVPIAVNEESTLYEMNDRDAWQAELVTIDGQRPGRVVQQVVEPASYLVRYLILYCPDDGRRVLLPANAVTGIDAGEIHCVLTSRDVERMPDYTAPQLTRAVECEVYAAAKRTPHWIEEARLHEKPR